MNILNASYRLSRFIALVTGAIFLFGVSEAALAERGLARLPESLEAALAAFEADAVAWNWLPRLLRETYVGVKRTEIAHLSGRDLQAICDLYRVAF